MTSKKDRGRQTADHGPLFVAVSILQVMSTAAPLPRNRDWPGVMLWMATVAIALWMTGQAVVNARRFADRPFDFDEAVHALPAYQIALDLRALDVVGFVRDTVEQDRLAAYPFLHSWLLAPALVISGADTATARLANTAFVWIALLLAAWCARQLAPLRHRSAAGALAALIIVLTLPIWVYANSVLLESAGLVVTLAWFGAYLKARAGASQRWTWLAGALAAAAFFTKYSFGIFVFGGMMLGEALAIAANRRVDVRRLIALLAPMVVLGGGWLLLPDKAVRLSAYSTAQQSSLAFWSWENWLYAPINALRFYSPGPLSAGLMAAAVVLSALHRQDDGARKTLAAIVSGFAALTWVPQKDARFLYTVAPLLIPPAAALAVQAWSVVRGRRSLQALGLGLAAVELALGVGRLTVYPEALQTIYNTSPDTWAAYSFVIEHALAVGQRPRLLNAWHQINALAASWAYYERFGGNPGGDGYRLVGQSQIDSADEPARRELFDDLVESDEDVLITIDGSPAGDVTGWAVAEPALSEGRLAPLAQSEPLTLYIWPRETQERLLAGSLASAGDPITFTVRLNAYALSDQGHK